MYKLALDDYKHQTGIELAKHDLAERLQNCSSVDSIADIVRKQAQDFKKFQEKDKVFKSLKNVLTVLHKLPSAANFAQHHVGLVCP